MSSFHPQNTFGFNLGKSIEVDYCFGIILNHCDKNISLDFYMQVPAKGVDKTTRVFHNTLLSIPGLCQTSWHVPVCGVCVCLFVCVCVFVVCVCVCVSVVCVCVSVCV